MPRAQADVSQMKQCMTTILSEIDHFSSKINTVKPLSVDGQGEGGIGEGYRNSVDLNQWMYDIRTKLSEVKEPSATCMFLIRTILETLCEGSMTEKEIKTCLIETCRDLGVKPTGRGTISGLNIDVGTACAVLSAIGILDVDTSAFSRVASHDEISTFRQTLQVTAAPTLTTENVVPEVPVAEQYFDMNSNSYISSMATDNGSSDAVGSNRDPALQQHPAMDPQTEAILREHAMRVEAIRQVYIQRLTELKACATAYHNKSLSGGLAAEDYQEILRLETSLLPDSQGKILLANMCSKWAPHLGKLYDEAKRAAKRAAMEMDATKLAAEAARLAAAQSTNSQPPQPEGMPSELARMHYFQEGRSEPNSAVYKQPLSDQIHVNANTANQVQLADGGPEVHVAQPISSTAQSAPTLENIADQAAAKKARKKSLKALANAARAEVSEAVIDATGMRVSKRTSNQRAWKLDDRTPFHETMSWPGHTLLEWAKACYDEAAALEKEEQLLRRLAGQCNLHLSNTNYRMGTRYLAASSRENCEFGAAAGPSVPTSFKDGVQFTASMLWEKARKAYKRSRALAPPGFHPPKSSMPSMHPGPYFSRYEGVPNAGERDEVEKTAKKAKTAHLADSHHYGHHINSLSSSGYVNPRFSVPWRAHLDHITMLNPSMKLEGSLYAAYNTSSGPTQSSLTATAFIEDLAIKTADVPWSMICSEFIQLDADDPEYSFNGDITTSPRAAMGPGRPRIRNSSPRGSTQSLCRHSSGDMEHLNTDSSSPRSSGAGMCSPRGGAGRDDGKTWPDEKSEGDLDKSTASFVDLLAPPFMETPYDLVSASPWFLNLPAMHCSNLYTNLYLPYLRLYLHQMAEVAAYKQSANYDSEPDEELSDAAFAARHEDVLKKMRERSALIAQLKRECKEMNAGGVGGGSSSTSPRASYNGNRRRGHMRRGNVDNLRRRGRPPKGGGSPRSGGEEEEGTDGQTAPEGSQIRS